jgi:uncharacterized Rossmann fold enzyme
MQLDDRLMQIYYIVKNLIRSTAGMVLFYIEDRKMYKLIKLNKRFKNIHHGKRCFILGNGPSIKDEDMSILEGEHIFVVNQCSRNDYYKEIKASYYICCDNVFFDICEERPEDVELLESFYNIKSGKSDPECFFPVEQDKRFIKRFDLDKKLKINYFKMGLNYHEGYSRKIDFTKIIPGSGTIVHFAISLAIYMGFKEIYLLGCDTTGIVVSINALLKNISDSDYSYHVTENEKIRIEKMLNKNKLESLCKSYLNTLYAYRWIYDYCNKNDISLINCSSKTVIDIIPRRKLNDILINKK